jgi:hypothetical protein
MTGSPRPKCCQDCRRLPVASAAMQLGESTSRDGLVCVWLRSEWTAPPPRVADRRLVDQPNLDDAVENATRLKLLRRDRAVVLDHVPAASEHVWVTIEAADLAQLYVIPCREW